MRKRLFILLGAVLALGSIAALTGLPWLRERWGMDGCLDRGGRWDHRTQQCVMEDPEDLLRGLPTISYADQCSGGSCDHAVEARVFGVLDSLGGAVLERGMPIARVRSLLGAPPDRYLPPLTFRDVRRGHRVDIWTFAVSLSGTYEYFLAFVDGCLDDFGRMQVGTLMVVYGRSGHTSEAVPDADYRPGRSCGEVGRGPARERTAREP